MQTRQDQQYHKLISKFSNTFKLCRNNVEKFLLLLRKGVYAYEYMNSTDKFIETELLTIDKFYSKLKGDNITTDDYNHAKKSVGSV